MVTNYEWVKITLSTGRKFYMRDYDWNSKVLNQVGQYGMRFFSPTGKLFYVVHNETADKIILKDTDNFGFNPNFIETIDIVRDKEVEEK